MRVIDMFDQGTNYHGEQLAFLDDSTGEAATYNELSHRTHAIAHAIRAKKFPKGTRIGVLAPNGLEAFAALLGLMRAESAWLPVNPRNSVQISADLLTRFDSELLFFHSRYAEEARTLVATVPTIKEAVCLDAATDFAMPLSTWMPDPRGRHEIGVEEADDLLGIFPTGGTTGSPKGVLFSHQCVAAMYANMTSHFSYREGSRHLIVAPMTHAAGLSSFVHFPRGGCNISMGSTDPLAILDAITRHHITHVFLPPTLLYGLLEHADPARHDFSNLVQILIAAAPTAFEKLRQAIDVFGPVMTECYGQVEAPMAVCLKAPWDYVRADGSIDERRLQSTGRPGIWNKVAILDADGQEVARGQQGEISVKGSIVSPGYYKNPTATAERRANGWHLTGDIGVMDADGYITIVDRKSDMIITGGFNVFPNEIEQSLSSHPAVQEAAVIGVPDKKWGEAVKGFVQLKVGHEVEVADLIDLVRSQLGPVKTPKSIEIMADLPRSPAGKVLRAELKRPYWSSNARSVA